MKSLREDILLSRLIQLSILGSLLIIGLLLLLQEYDILMPDLILSKELQEIPVADEADSLIQTENPLWLRHSADWIDTHLLEPLRKWK